MQGVLVVGRILFVLIFIVGGALKLMDLDGTAAIIAPKVDALPAALAGIAAKVTTATGIATPKLLAIVGGAGEVIGGLLMVFGIGTRFAALILIIYEVIVTYYSHDWSMAGPDRTANILSALQDISVIGALLVLFAVGSRRMAESAPIEVLE
jgi:putative oxidoreductase